MDGYNTVQKAAAIKANEKAVPSETPETPEKPEKQTPEPKGNTESTADKQRREAAEKKLERVEQEN
jgi:hypothetical protein